jgi:hypothetical protein
VKAGTKPWLRVTLRGATDYGTIIDFTNGVLVDSPTKTWDSSLSKPRWGLVRDHAQDAAGGGALVLGSAGAGQRLG